MRRKEREISDISVIEDIISRADVCRIAIANDNVPYIVTMNFGYLSSPHLTFYFHCAGKGRKLEMLFKNNWVCFEIDIDHRLYEGTRACDWGMKYSSIVGYGNITIISETEEKISGLNCIMDHYAGDKKYQINEEMAEGTTILRLDIKEITGKKC